MANWGGVFTVVLFSQTAWIVLYLVSSFPILTQPHIVLPVGVAALCGVVCILSTMLTSSVTTSNETNPNVKSRGLIYYTCCLFSWTCIVDLIFYFEVIGVVKGFMRFYLETGEPYFDCSFGALSLLGDAIINYLLVLLIIYQIDNELDCRNAVLFWGASAITNLFCILVGAITGSFGKNIHSASFLNLPYIFLPVYFLLQFLFQPRYFKNEPVQKEQKSLSLFKYTLTVGLAVTCIFGFVRGLAALGSPLPIANYYANTIEPYVTEPTKFGAVWPIFFMCVGSLLQIVLIYGLNHPGMEWMLDWSIIYAGIAFSGSYLQMAQFLPGVNLQYHPPPNSVALVFVANLLIPCLAIGLVMTCFVESNFFRRSCTKTD